MKLTSLSAFALAAIIGVSPVMAAEAVPAAKAEAPKAKAKAAKAPKAKAKAKAAPPHGRGGNRPRNDVPSGKLY